MSSAVEKAATSAGSRDATVQFRTALAERIGAHRFGLWFEHGTSIALDGSTARIGAANAYVRDWILRHFQGQLDTVARDVLGADATCEVGLADSSPAETPVAASGRTQAPARSHLPLDPRPRRAY